MALESCAEQRNGNSGLRVLVVDDHVDGAEVLAELLRLWGHEATTVNAGTDAVEEFAAQRHDVILLDLGLPDLSGMMVCRAIRASQPEHGPKIFAVTGYCGTDVRDRALADGFDDHLTKPVSFARLEQLLKEVARNINTVTASVNLK